MQKKALYYLALIMFIAWVLSLSLTSSAQSYFKGPALIEGITTYVSSGGNTVLTKDSQTNLRITGTLTQTITLPDATTIPVGRRFYISNMSTGTLTVNGSTGALLASVLSTNAISVRLFDASTAAGVWNVETDYSVVPASVITGILPLANGGTNNNNVASAGSVAYSTASAISLTAVGVSGQFLKSEGTGVPIWSYVTAGDVSGPASSTDSGIVLFNGTTGKVIKQATGSGFVRSLSGVYQLSTAISLTSDVAGILPLANGGTNNNITAINGGVAYGTASAISLTAVGVSGQVLTSQGAAAPIWANAAATGGDVSGPASSTDSGIVLFNGTTGKTIKQATGTGFVRSLSGVYQLSSAISLTSDVSGILPLANGGTNAANVASNGGFAMSTATTISIGPVGSSGQIPRSAGAGMYTWSTATYPATAGTSGNVLTSDGTNWISATATGGSVSVPTYQFFTSGSGTYTTPAGVRQIRVYMVGGGGGGSGASGSGLDGGTGGNTTFGSSLLTANGGGGGASGSGGGASGGTATISAPATGTAIQGGGGTGRQTIANTNGGTGGSSCYGGGGIGGPVGSNGGNGSTNSGGGGGGKGGDGGAGSGGGGAAGGCIQAIINSPSSTYAYSVGSGGSAGSGGGTGGSGYIRVEEYY